MDIGSEISADVQIGVELVKVIKAVMAKQDSGIIAKVEDLVEAVMADADLKSAVAAALAALK